MIDQEYIVLELIVKNHAGVMSHVTGLFSRRAFNLEGILCGRIGDGTMSRMYLLIKHDDRVEQITKQLQKLYDVIEVTLHESFDVNFFTRSYDSL